MVPGADFWIGVDENGLREAEKFTRWLMFSIISTDGRKPERGCWRMCKSPKRSGSGETDEELSGRDCMLRANGKYGRFHGFGIRKADSGKDCDRNVVRYRFFYNREERHGRHYDRIDQMRVHKLETKANCRGKLSIYFEKIEQIWKVRKVILEHNHELTPVSMAHMIANHREISEAAKATTDGIHAHGIAT
ncbi:hypothetical protein Ahy_B01g053113 [Arachis hypogaea]|uniref:FAR1 domain-containing protein n=1 Tax=Arachis hypogaea TaxID=3818 RepID=A0A445AR29_ARAHY|nr:hypothetical protein Ahy_B01g053113 [Arachis hypogaea]